MMCRHLGRMRAESMSNLLIVLRHQPKALSRKTVVPLLVEVEGVSPDTAPYLVSAVKDPWFWIEEPHPDNHIKAAVRTMTTPGRIFLDAVQEVARRGKLAEWENGFDFS